MEKNLHPATIRSRQLLTSLGKTPESKLHYLKEEYPLQYWHVPGESTEVAYIASKDNPSFGVKPTIVILPGIFQDVKEMPVTVWAIQHTFGVRVVVPDYASLASKKGIDGISHNLPLLLAHIEGSSTNIPSRVVIGESLGGIVGQVLAYENSPEMNIDHLILSHTTPPQHLDGRTQLVLKGLLALTPFVPMVLARRIIALGVDIQLKYLNAIDKGGQLDAELAEIQKILSSERSQLTKRRGVGYTKALVDSYTRTKGKHLKSSVPVDVIISKDDAIFPNVSDSEWSKYHPDVHVIQYSGPGGHYVSRVRNDWLLNQAIIPLLAHLLPIAS